MALPPPLGLISQTRILEPSIMPIIALVGLKNLARRRVMTQQKSRRRPTMA